MPTIGNLLTLTPVCVLRKDTSNAGCIPCSFVLSFMLSRCYHLSPFSLHTSLPLPFRGVVRSEKQVPWKEACSNALSRSFSICPNPLTLSTW